MAGVPSRASAGEQTAWWRVVAAVVRPGEERSQPSLAGGCWEQTLVCLGLHVATGPRRMPACGEGAVGSASPASPTYTLLLGAPAQSGPAFCSPPCSSPSAGLPISWAPHSRLDCLAAIQGGVQLPGILQDGVGRRLQPGWVLASAPAVTEELWF